jgi:hypothetical protein
MARAGFYAVESSTIRFGRDGRWYADGAPIENRRIADLFARHVERAEDGSYRLRMGEEQVRIEVDDTPYVVTDVGEGPEGFSIRLNDRSTERLDVRSLEVGAEEVLYCTVKGGAERARFLRPAYYQLARHFVETSPGVYVLRHGESTQRIARRVA